MANDSTSFFYWYRRYKVRAADMTAFQEAMAETARGLGEGSFGAAILRGFSVSPVSGLSVNIGAGIATAPSGYLDVMNDSVVLDVTNASASGYPCRSLVVATPLLTDDNFINSPTVPFLQVPLNQLQQVRVQLLPGTPGALPDYPAKGPNDVILCGLIVPPGTNAITQAMIDYEVRESVGVNSLVGQNQVRFDNRLRPFRSSPKVLGIKPSQNIGSAPLCFSYPGRLTPSIFPVNSGAFNPQDTFVDFSTGMISGGDTTTPPFVPNIPGTNRSMVCVVTLTQNDTLKFNFGDKTGTYSQCLAAIQNQQFSGPGGLPALDGNFGIAYVILTSLGGSLSDVQVFDGRPFLGSGAAAAKFQSEKPTGLIDGTNNVFNLSKAPSDVESVFFYVDDNLLDNDIDFTISGTQITIQNPAFIPQLGQSVYTKFLIFGAVSNNSSISIPTAKFKQEVPVGLVDGTNDTFELSTLPVDPESIDFWVDENHLELTDFTLAGTTVTITNSAFIPKLGQSVYTKYLYLGAIITGGGASGGASGYSPHGSKTFPVLIQPSTGIVSTSEPMQTWFIRSPSGAQVVTANPQIAAGSAVGQVMKIKAVDGTNYPIFQDGNGLSIAGVWPVTGQPANVVVDSSIELSWDGITWSEDSRR